MVGAGESYFAAYSLSLGHSELEAGGLITLPIVFGGIAQLISPFLMGKVGAYKPIVMAGVVGQLLSLAVLIFASSVFKANYLLLFFLVTFYWIMAMGVVPAWNSWISRLLDADQIRNFFSLRNSFLGIGTLIGLTFSGLMLQNKASFFSLATFEVIFGLCIIARTISLLLLQVHPRVEFVRPEKMNFKFAPLGTTDKDKFLHQFFIFSSIFKIGVFFSASFFTPYMLVQLNFSYLDYTAILVASFLGRIFIGYYLRRKLNRFDVNLLYFISAAGISLIPVLWILLSKIYLIFSLELFTGMLWGIFEICFLVTVFEEIPTEKQSVYMTRYNFWHTLSIGIGAVLGIIFFYFLKELQNIYFIIFFISTMLRGISLFFFPRKLITTKKTFFADLFRVIAVRPNMGMIGRPMWQILRRFKK